MSDRKWGELLYIFQLLFTQNLGCNQYNLLPISFPFKLPIRNVKLVRSSAIATQNPACLNGLGSQYSYKSIISSQFQPNHPKFIPSFTWTAITASIYNCALTYTNLHILVPLINKRPRKGYIKKEKNW